MALELSVRAQLLLDQVNVEQQIVLEIDGIGFVYAAVDVNVAFTYGGGGTFGGGGVYGGSVVDPNSRPYISLGGTTRNITQQLEIDKGGSGSVTKFNVTLVDFNEEITQTFSPGFVVSDILGREANVYIAFQKGFHPEDSVRIFNGIITGQEAAPASWKISIDAPEFLKRREIFQQTITTLTGAIDASTTTITLASLDGLIIPQDVVKSYVRIEDELIEFTGVDTGTSTLTGVVRGALTTIAAAHDDESEVTSYYTLSGDPVDVALKIMLSNAGNTAFLSDTEVPNFVQVTATDNIPNGIFVNNSRFQDETGVVAGDLVTVTGATNAANNFVERTILSFVSHDTGTTLVVDGADLVTETGSSAVASFKSQYNTLPEGAGCSMKPSQVDTLEHERMKVLFPSLPEYLFYIPETVSSAKEFLATQVYFPAGFYQVPRKARASVAATLPPIAVEKLVEINDTNVVSPAKNKIIRQLTKNFYNNVVYRYNKDELDDRYRAGEVVFSQRSLNRMPTANRTLTIDSDGFRDDDTTNNFIRNQIRRFSDRYQFAPESLDVEVNYKTGMPVEISDVVLFGNGSLQLPDITQASRDFQPRLMEVVNKKLDLRGNVVLSMLDTGFGLDGRFAVISPNSFMDTGSTTTTLFFKISFASTDIISEREKWEPFVGEEIRVRSQDFSFQETVTLVQFTDGILNGLTISPALSVAPPEDYVIDLPDYPDDTDNLRNFKMKALHPFFTPEVEIVSGIDNTSFTVAPADIDKFFVGSYVIVHNDDFTNSSTVDTEDEDAQVTVVDTGTNTITLSRDMGFTPAAGYKANAIGFKDRGLPYRVI